MLERRHQAGAGEAFTGKSKHFLRIENTLSDGIESTIHSFANLLWNRDTADFLVKEFCMVGCAQRQDTHYNRNTNICFISTYAADGRFQPVRGFSLCIILHYPGPLLEKGNDWVEAKILADRR